MDMMLSEKMRPSKISRMIGNEEARLEAAKWLKNWSLGSKPLLLTGPPGVGKSTLVYALAQEFGYSVIEYNASDVRTRDALEERIGPMLNNQSLFSDEGRFLVFLDEIDGLSGRADYAGIDFVLDFVENVPVPVVLAANVEDDQRLKKIVQKSHHLRFQPVAEDVLYIYLKEISRQEGLKEVTNDALKRIARTSRGDVRFALNSLQTFIASREGNPESTDRQFPTDQEALASIFEAGTFEESIERMRNLDAQPRDKVRYFFDAIVGAKNLDARAKADALSLVADADILMGEINKTQSWRLLRYLDRILVKSAFGRSLVPVEGSIPWNLRLSIWNDGRVMKDLLPTLSARFHVGKSSFSSFYLPYVSLYFKRNETGFEKFARSNGLGDSEKRVILKFSTRK
jgi:replication factor C large subunit